MLSAQKPLADQSSSLRCRLYCHKFLDIELNHDSLEKRFYTACKDVPRHLIHNNQIKDAALLAELREVHQIKVVATPSPGNSTVTSGKIFLPHHAVLTDLSAKGARESPEQQDTSKSKTQRPILHKSRLWHYLHPTQVHTAH